MKADLKPSQPWQKPFYNSFGILRLHEELLDFCNYVQPTILEGKVRELVVEKVKNAILERWPSASVQVFGSFATGLYLPTSDIDIVVFGDWRSSPMWTVDRLLRDKNISTDVRVIDKAAVPIVKFTEKESGLRVDISFNKANGLESIPYINDSMRRFPHLKQLFLVLKHFMLQRDLNEVFTGGIGSYCLMLMCISFMQHFNKNFSGPINLGCLLMEFLELYSRSFNFLSTGISVRNKGAYRSKQDVNSSMTSNGHGNGHRGALLSIDDPIEEDNDVARSCYGIFVIRSAFANAYSKLHNKVVPACIIGDHGDGNHDNYDDDDDVVVVREIDSRDSVLGSIVTVDKEAIEFRERLKIKFASLVDNDVAAMTTRRPLSMAVSKAVARRSQRTANQRKKPTATKRPRKSTPTARSIIHKAHNWADLSDWSQRVVFRNQ